MQIIVKNCKLQPFLKFALRLICRFYSNTVRICTLTVRDNLARAYTHKYIYRGCLTHKDVNVFIFFEKLLFLYENDDESRKWNDRFFKTMVNDDPSLPIVNEESKETDLKDICTYHWVVFKKNVKTFNKVACIFFSKRSFFQKRPFW